MKIVIAGGGTGGHLFPGIALAQSLSRKDKQLTTKNETLFLCTDRPFDAKQLARYQFDYKIVSSPRLSASPLFIFKLIKSVNTAYRIMSRFNPDCVIGLGGYGSFSTLLVAKMRGIPIILLEQNVLPGKVTRRFSAWARYVACQWKGSARHLANPLRARLTGSPVRDEIKRIARRDAASKLGINPSRKTLAIIGGSQGAEAINRFILDNIDLVKSYKDRIALIHLCGEKDYPALKEAYSKCDGLSYHLSPFTEDMSTVYSAADLVLARSGGITIAELTALGLPAVLVPFPYAAENHQYYNALGMTNQNASILIEQKDLSPDKLKHIIEKVLLDEPTLSKMAEASKTLGNPDSSQKIIALMK
ncbi:MAG: undecaprenyldiphospho-muramoylpentapeptide beta-N-acetylglucosaminyltransferase [Planctomycetes bacterium]|nr:undecaprenyldiphospho-muramoylpentapeptide beta-N-acetylglucosaminyltransferase [Planctomycetota bacterium]